MICYFTLHLAYIKTKTLTENNENKNSTKYDLHLDQNEHKFLT